MPDKYIGMEFFFHHFLFQQQKYFFHIIQYVRIEKEGKILRFATNCRPSKHVYKFKCLRIVTVREVMS